jgi:hypothetical protein
MRHIPYTEMLDAILAKVFSDNELPKETKSKMLHIDPILASPYTEMLDPRRKAFLSENMEPMFTKSSTDS